MMKKLMRTRKSVISIDILPATISGGIRKLTQDIITKRLEGR
jgi:23S rRNA U2552 (ribose-2'-O)-methylase RlmE/FtsJ